MDRRMEKVNSESALIGLMLWHKWTFCEANGAMGDISRVETTAPLRKSSIV